MDKIKRKNSIIITFSAPPSVFEKMKKFAASKEITLSEMLRRAFELFEYQEARDRYGRYGGTQVGKAKITRLMKAEQRENNIKMIQSSSPAELENFLIGIEYFPPDGIDGRNEFAGVYCRHKITENKEYVQAYINIKDGTESYRNMIFNLDDLIKDLDKQNKI